MRFAVDAHALGRHLTGNEVYIRSLLRAFDGQREDCEILAYVAPDDASRLLPPGIRTRRVAANPFLRLGFDLSMKLRRDRPDLLHVQYTAPIGCPVPFVVSVHDVSFVEHPEYFTRGRAFQLQYTVRRSVRNAARILTVSEFSKQSILRVYGELEEDKVVVAPNAAAAEFRPVSRESAIAMAYSRYQLKTPFILSVGDLQPRKNHIGLIKAFAELVKAHPKLKHTLALAGKDTWFAGRVHEAARNSGVADRIQFLGFVPDTELVQLYNACELFTFPSFYEGFGLPILEAMACGRAVACSNTTAMPEVADGAAILFDPYSTEETTRAMADLLLDSELRTRMERLGLKRAALFSWQKSARQILDVFQSVVEQPGAARQAAGSPSIAHR
jgi:glycosyltransferase involved in cell wall biosynthesis